LTGGERDGGLEDHVVDQAVLADARGNCQQGVVREDLDRLLSPGFAPAERFPAYLSKVLSYRREPDPRRRRGC